MCKHNTRGSGDCMSCVEIKMSRRTQQLQQRSRSANEGTMYQRGLNHEAPNGMSVNGQRGAYGTVGAEEHITLYGDDWRRSWNNPGRDRDHTTIL